MAVAMKGLRIKPSYEQLIGIAVSDGLGQIKFLNRNAFLFKMALSSYHWMAKVCGSWKINKRDTLKKYIRILH